MNKRAFTLAEVLITLGIIGVVAAMTLPTLLNKYQEVVTVNKVKKFYSTINNAFLRAVTEHGNVNTWGYEDVGGWVSSKKNSELIGKRIVPYLKVGKDCGFQPNCMLVVDYKFLNGNAWGTYTNYRDELFYKMILNDGSHVVIKAQGTACNMRDGGYENTCGYILYDTNGAKEPNTFGKDVFSFMILKNAIAPNKLDNYQKTVSNRQGTGSTAYILLHSDMKYLR